MNFWDEYWRKATEYIAAQSETAAANQLLIDNYYASQKDAKAQRSSQMNAMSAIAQQSQGGWTPPELLQSYSKGKTTLG